MPKSTFLRVVGADASSSKGLGDVSTLGKDGKLHIPATCLRAVAWPLTPSPIALIAELVEPGHLRLHLEIDVREKIEALQLQLDASDSPDVEDLLSIVRDRYRQVQLYTLNRENRVRLTPAVSVILSEHEGAELARTIYIEPRGAHLEVMSQQFRARRLARLRHETSISV